MRLLVSTLFYVYAFPHFHAALKIYCSSHVEPIGEQRAFDTSKNKADNYEEKHKIKVLHSYCCIFLMGQAAESYLNVETSPTNPASPN